MKKISLLLLVLLFFQQMGKPNSIQVKNNEKDTISTIKNDKLSSKDFLPGNNHSIQDLINGKFTGVRVISNSADPGASFSIISRGYSCLYELDHPLVYVDGIPMYIEPEGFGNFLNVIDPQNVESIQFLKNGNEIVPYGYSAGNGVLLITTKRSNSKKPISIRFSNTASILSNTNTVDVLSATQYKKALSEHLPANSDYKSQLGNSNTNWQDEVLQNAFGHHQHLSLSGLLGKTSYRIAGGHNKQEGILKNSDYSRWTASLQLNRKLLDDQLALSLGYQTAKIDHEFGNQKAYEAAVIFDPTQASSSREDIYRNEYNTIYNPVKMLQMSGNGTDQRNWTLNFKADYNLPFVKGMKASFLIGKNKSDDNWNRFAISNHYSSGNQLTSANGESYEMNTTIIKAGIDYHTRINDVLSGLNVGIGYIKEKDKLRTGKASYESMGSASDVIQNPNTNSHQNYSYNVDRKIKSLYGLVSLELWERLTLGGNYRLDAGEKWDQNVKSASFDVNYQVLKKDKGSVLNTLDLRIGYAILGKTGDEMIRKQVGREYTTNFGIDLSFLNNRLSASIEGYILKHKNVFFEENYHSILGNQPIIMNSAQIENKGFELSLQATPVANDKISWNLQCNIACNKNKLLQLDENGARNTYYNQQGRFFKVGEELYSFYLYPQVYGPNGKPLENSGELRMYKSAAPKVMFGFSSQFRYKQWDAAFTLRGNIGNYTYDAVAAQRGHYGNAPFNMHKSVLETDFTRQHASSDYYLNNASFVRMENISIGYSISKLFGKDIKTRIYATARNLFTITGYDGLNPDTVYGIDAQTLSQARSVALGFQFDF